VALTATVAVGWNGTAVAGKAESDLPTQAVRYGDLDLTSAAGTKVLYRRIQGAAEQVCGGPTTARGDFAATRNARIRACIAQATERAVTDVRSAALTDLHEARTGRSPLTLLIAKRR
jgi:UrcA family protein